MGKIVLLYVFADIVNRCIERSVYLMYNCMINSVKVNDCRKELSIKTGRPMETIPLILKALCQHIYRSVYQAGYVWGEGLVTKPLRPKPID